MLTLKMNDSTVVAIKTGVLPVSVNVKGVPTKALQIVVDADNMDVSKIKDIFGRELATSEMALCTENGDVASTHTGFTNLRSINYDVDANAFTVVLAKETNIPEMISNLDATVQKLIKQVEDSDAAVKKQYNSVVIETTIAVENLKSQIQNIDNKVNTFVAANTEAATPSVDETVNTEEKTAETEDLNADSEGL